MTYQMKLFSEDAFGLGDLKIQSFAAATHRFHIQERPYSRLVSFLGYFLQTLLLYQAIGISSAHANKPTPETTSAFSLMKRSDDVRKLPLNLELYEDFKYSSKFDPNSTFARQCVHTIGNAHYDFRALAGSYILSSKIDNSEFRVKYVSPSYSNSFCHLTCSHLHGYNWTNTYNSICIEPKHCNGQNNTVICRQKRLIKSSGIEGSLSWK